jgi:hypothetical protein
VDDDMSQATHGVFPVSPAAKAFFEHAHRTGEYRCPVTKNPCGTDTTLVGVECPLGTVCPWREAYEAGWDARAALAIWPVLPKEPPPGLLMSMAIRYDHDLGVPGYYDNPMFGDCLTHAQRLTSTLTTMRQLYEEVSGHGFYRPEKEAEYAAQSGHNAWTVEE